MARKPAAAMTSTPPPEETPAAVADPGRVDLLEQQVAWQLQHAGELVVCIRDHRRTEVRRDVPFRFGKSDPIPASHHAIPYFLERPNEYVVAPAEAITLAEYQPSLLELENLALKQRVADLEAALAAKE